MTEDIYNKTERSRQRRALFALYELNPFTLLLAKGKEKGIDIWKITLT